jgi:hypothetical protein
MLQQGNRQTVAAVFLAFIDLVYSTLRLPAFRHQRQVPENMAADNRGHTSGKIFMAERCDCAPAGDLALAWRAP